MQLQLAGACGQAMRSGGRVVIADVMADECFAPFRGIAVASGFRAVQATPLLGAGGRLLGMMSTHWARRHLPSARDQRMTDLYARQVADFIERMRTDAALRKSAVSLAQADRRQAAAWPARRESRSPPQSRGTARRLRLPSRRQSRRYGPNASPGRMRNPRRRAPP